ncbi:hypothetical protein QGN32_08255 [Mycolicibacterium sp. ND9-15]|uniref:hypothetical protein n=1 Tax=Mycolicibacterium sp. ND9-15 TaxID=3042320 RepID=UPI002DDAFCAC|nr:hypothetical protein [Mycolicibacterium sp. ND9-15]WSE57830.1 hypothetical protein QGN32_08255 [Mycolicibacterium sp. ND9-15]
MTEQLPAVTASHPPDKVLRMVNPVIGRLLRTPLAGPLRSRMMVVDVVGRKTGRRYSIPVTAHKIDGELYALTAAGWKNNFRDGATADVVVDGRTTTMRGQLLTDTALVAELCHRCAKNWGPKRAPTMMGLKFRDGGIPSVEDFAEAVRRERIAAVRFTPA